jgi:hypothetical protein
MLVDRRLLRALAVVVITGWLGCSDRGGQSGGSDDNGVGPETPGFCWKLCDVGLDCCALFDGVARDNCLADFADSHLFCDAGRCSFAGCSSDQECRIETGIDAFACHGTDRHGLCVLPCTDDGDCDILPYDAICGALDDGFVACVPPPCQTDADCPNDKFHCMAGDCVYVECMTDADCTQGGSCTADHECRCQHSSECGDELDCIPVGA